MTTNDLLLMINDDYEIQQEVEELSFPYIPRFLSRNLVDLQFLNNSRDDSLIVISNINSQEQDDITKNCTIVGVEEYLKTEDRSKKRAKFDNKPILVASKDHCTPQQFRKVCDKKKFKSYHHLKFFRHKLEWVKSVGDITSLQRFRFQDDSVIEDELRELNSENNIHLVVGNPGLGKSTLLKSLKNKFESNGLTILLTPHDMKQICIFFKKDPNVHKLNEEILKMKYPNWTRFDHDVVNSLIKTENIKVVYLWDALDEILSDKHREVIIKIVHTFSEQGFVQWMTCRQHLKNTLEAEFCVLSRVVFEFEEHQQIEYIKKRLKFVQSNRSLTARRIIENVTFYKHRDILSIPLQIYMLTETLRENKNRIQDFTERYFSLGDLYEYFVDEKINFCYKKNPKFDDSDLDDFSQEKQALINQLETFALRTIFSDDVLKCLHVNIKEIEKNIKTFQDRFGFVTDIINSQSLIKFSHISYAEYLAARYLVRQNDPHIKDFIFKEKYTNVRYFFDFILAGNCPVHIAVLCDNISQVRKQEDKLEVKDAAGRNPLQLACSWGRRYQTQKFRKTKNHAGVETFFLDREDSTVTDNSLNNNLEIIEILLPRYDVFEKDTIFELTAIDYAEATDNIFALAAIEENCKMNYFDADNFNLQCNILYFSVLLGVPNFFRLFRCYLNCLTIYRSENSLLHLACEKGKEKVVELLISQGGEINASNKYGDTPLFCACAKGHEQIVELLISKKVDINAFNKIGDTPLIYACCGGHEKIVEMLIDKGADFDTSNADGDTLLILACANRYSKVVEVLVSKGADFNVSNRTGDTPLIVACGKGLEKAVELLISKGVDINASNKFGDQPLILSCAKNHKKIVELLISKGANINASNKIGDGALICACAGGHYEIVKMLINEGANINAFNKTGDTPLIRACSGGYEEIVELLINKGADTNASNQIGDTSLLLACGGGHKKVVQLLITKGADINTCDKHNESPLSRACAKEHEKIVKLLINEGADITASDIVGDTPLTLACRNGQHNIVKVLINKGADINASNKVGDKPLIFACSEGHETVVELLVKAGADINSSDIVGNTPLILACNGEHKTIVELLINKGADINATNKFGKTPLTLASETKNEQIMQLLINVAASTTPTN